MLLGTAVKQAYIVQHSARQQAVDSTISHTHTLVLQDRTQSTHLDLWVVKSPMYAAVVGLHAVCWLEVIWQ